VQETGAERAAKGFSSWDHFVAMLFCHLCNAQCGICVKVSGHAEFRTKGSTINQTPAEGRVIKNRGMLRKVRKQRRP
jgi:hypothetical protein